MKTNKQLFQPILKLEEVDLTKQVKETIAKNIPVVTLSSAQLWNIQRRGKMVTYRRSSL